MWSRLNVVGVSQNERHATHDRGVHPYVSCGYDSALIIVQAVHLTQEQILLRNE